MNGNIFWQKKFVIPASFIFTSFLVINSTQKKIIFVKEPPICDKDTKVIILVTSNAPNFELREAQR